MIDKSQVDAQGSLSSLLKKIFGIQSNPAGGILAHPEKKVNICDNVTSSRSINSYNAKKRNTVKDYAYYSFKIFVRL